MARNCKQCESRLPKHADSDHIQKMRFCTSDCLIKHWRENKPQYQQKAAKELSKEEKAEKRRRNYHDLKRQVDLTQKAFNKMIRLLDHGKPCICCDEHRELEAGHYRSVGSFPALRFDARNCHGQCNPCNGGGTRSHKRGKNPELVRTMFTDGLRARYSDDLVEWLNGPHSPANFTCDDLRAMRKVFSAEIRRLERGEKPSKDWRKL